MATLELELKSTQHMGRSIVTIMCRNDELSLMKTQLIIELNSSLWHIIVT